MDNYVKRMHDKKKGISTENRALELTHGLNRKLSKVNSLTCKLCNISRHIATVIVNWIQEWLC